MSIVVNVETCPTYQNYTPDLGNNAQGNFLKVNILLPLPKLFHLHPIQTNF